ncbi:MAG: HAMP domain-containing protein, partial [Gemmatimonadetes bacterium]
MGRIRSVERRVFLAILAVALIPAAFTLAVGAFALSEGLARAGAGPWEDAAESGRVLLEAVEAGAGADSALLAAARRHRETLSASMRLARRYQFVTDSARRAVPAAALAFAVLITLLAALAARLVARGVAEPIRALVDWTERIARDEPLPATGPAADVREFAALEDALRRMAGELSAARSREVEAARLRSWTEMARRVAHELKNPLTPMRMAAATVARAADPALAEAGRVLVDEVARLDEMARSFSQFGRMP